MHLTLLCPLLLLLCVTVCIYVLSTHILLSNLFNNNEVYFYYYIGLSLTRENAQRVLRKSHVLKYKSWQKTLRCFSFPMDDIERGLSPTQTIEDGLSQSQKIQYLSENWLKTEPYCDWWRLGMKLIRCCRRNEIETIHELMTNVANYNHSGKFK